MENSQNGWQLNGIQIGDGIRVNAIAPGFFIGSKIKVYY